MRDAKAFTAEASAASGTAARRTALLALALLASALLLAAAAGAAGAARTYSCQITALDDAPADECNGTGNVVPGEGFKGARGVAIDSAGDVWVSDATSSRILKFDPLGNFLALNDGSGAWEESTNIQKLAYGKAANLVYAPDTFTTEVWKLSAGAGATKLLQGPGYQGNLDAAVDNSGGPHDGDIYLSYGNNYVERVDPQGKPAPFEAFQPYLAGDRIAGTPESPGGWAPQAISVGPDGDVFVLAYSFSEGTTSVKRFDQTGAFVRSYSGEFSGSFGTSDVVVDPTNGNFLVADTAIGGLYEYDSGGTFLGLVDGVSTSSPGGSLGGLSDIDFSAAGRMFIADGSASVREFTPADPLPKIAYQAETGATRSQVDLHATVDPNGAGAITDCDVEYGTTLDYELGSVSCDPTPPPSFSTPTGVEAQLAGLQVEQDYHYRVVVTTAAGTRRGEDRMFRLDAVLDVLTGAATDVTTTTATLNGSFTDDGPATRYYFEYGNTPAFGQRSPLPPGADAPSGGGTIDVSTDLENLLPGAVYYYRVAASNSFGTTHGQILTFKTLQAPTIESFSATEVNETSADLVARINPNGFATNYRFEYGPTSVYGQVAPEPDGELAAASTVQDVAVHLDQLQSGVTYHFRLIAESAQGSTTTEDQTFTFFPPECPNAQVRLETGAAYLPDCRAYELVSPPDAGGILLEYDAPTASFATDPPRFGYSGIFGTLPDVGLPANVLGDLYVAERSNTGWTTKYVGIPSNVALENGGPPTESIGRPGGVLSDSSMSTFMVWNTGTQGYVCPCRFGSMAPYLLSPRGQQLGRLPTNLGEVTNGEEFIGDAKPSADFTHFFFSSTGPVFATGGLTTTPGSAYDNDRAAGTVTLISVAPGGGPLQQDPAGPMEPAEYIRFPAASRDGSRVLMSTAAASGRHLYMWDGGPQSVDVSKGQDGKNHGVEFVGMTGDGSEVIFTSTEQLTADDHDSSQDIFAWHESTGSVERASTGANGTGDTDECAATWTSKCDAVPVTPGAGSGLFGALKSTDTVFGTRDGGIYFYSPEQLDGVRGLLGQRNLYTVHDGQVEHVATLASDGPLMRTQVSPDGEHAAFLTTSRLTSYDNQGKAEMYSYDVDGRTLKCVSCVPSGAAPTVGVEASVNGLFMADDGRTFFTTADSLVDRDVNGVRDIYEFVDGRPQLISSGLAVRDTGLLGAFPAGLAGVSADGVNVYFASYDALVAQDHNGQFLRFYDARTGGGFPFRAPPAPCAAADECHGPGSSAPIAPPVSSQANLGHRGNVANGKGKRCRKKARCKKGKGKKKNHHRKHRGTRR